MTPNIPNCKQSNNRFANKIDLAPNKNPALKSQCKGDNCTKTKQRIEGHSSWKTPYNCQDHLHPKSLTHKVEALNTTTPLCLYI
ncbi:hypothetical protein GDO86_008922 [Hymenochirus boettgeri]|uniref:Uncharacterized protein n=1 Tax=Hymenochirus boettgeri TaxID=247094 RepID=A0A8T2J3Q9_9PIPI|nr:hypothetical protein GDO86_008922 [Hymenochirus boettgeri]